MNIQISLLLMMTLAVFAQGVIVNPDGSGDYPTIQDAMDATASGEIIRLGAGVFSGPGNWDLDPGDKKFRILGDSGNAEDVIFDLADTASRTPHRAFILVDPGNEGFRLEDITFRNGIAPDGNGGVATISNIVWMDFRSCIFENNQAEYGGAIYNEGTEVYVVDCFFRLNIADQGGCMYGTGQNYFPIWGGRYENNHANDRGGVVATAAGSTGSVVMNEVVFWQNSATLSGGVAYLADSSDGYVTHSTLVENLAPIASAAYLNDLFYIEHSIIVWGNSAPIQGTGVGINILCNDIFGNTGGDYTGPLTGQLGSNGNISEDPQFCGFTDGYFALQSDSPCAAENSPCTDELIGALAVDCGELATVLMHWDAVKALY